MTTADYPDRPGTAALGADAEPPPQGAYTAPVGAGGSSAVGGGSSGTGQVAKEQAKQTAGTAADEGKRVAGVAQDEARNVASEARSQVRGLVDQATTQVEDQSRTQRDRLVDTLRSLADDLQSMAGQSDGNLAGNLAHEAADRVRSVSSHLDGREPRDLLEDVRGFARRRPGAFLLGALAAGVVAGRLTRGARDAQSGSAGSGPGVSRSSTGAGSTYPSEAVPPRAAVVDPGAPAAGTAGGTPLAGTGRPTSDPTYPGGSELSRETGARGDLS